MTEGPFAGASGTVDELTSAMRIKALIVLFNQPTPVALNIAQVRLAKRA